MILGDTWGIVPCHTFGWQPQIVNWFEYQFLKRGHPTFNKSWGGNSNNYQLMQAEVFLTATQGTPMFPDLIIWFHSELMRDTIPAETAMFGTVDYDVVLDTIADRMYTQVSALKSKFPTVKWAIMGGHAPLRPNKTHLLDWADFKIENLRAKITGVDVPESQAFEFLEKGKGSLWDWPGIPTEIIDRELAIKEQIIAITKDKSKFYNEKHPALEPLVALSAEIIEHFKL